MPYVDVHAHLTHPKFLGDVESVVQNAMDAGVEAVISNGLNPESNRQVLMLADTYEIIKPALGIYPIDAVNDIVGESLPFPVAKFAVDAEIAFIDEQASKGKLIAIGECGLDGHWVGDDTFARQEYVFESLIDIAKSHDLPLIIHTRKLEKRSMEILEHHQVERVDFHCYGGKSKLAINASRKHGWWFSIPANARKNESFTKLLKELPEERILTETDCPYLAPQRGQRNEPANVVDTVTYLSELKGWDIERAQELVWQNYRALFASGGD